SAKAAAANASRSAGADTWAGMLTGCLHAGHRSLLPACSSLTTRDFWHLALGHLKRMAIGAQRSGGLGPHSLVSSSFHKKAHGLQPVGWFSLRASHGPLLQDGQAHAALAQRPGRLRLERTAGGLFLLPGVNLFEQRVHHLALQDVADDLPAAEDHALALAG